MMFLWGLSLTQYIFIVYIYEIQPVHSKGDQPSGCSLEGMMLKLKLQYFGYLMQRVDSLEKILMLGGIGGQEEKGTTEDEMAGWHHWLSGCEFEWTLGLVDGQEACRAAIHRVAKSRTWLSNWTELICGFKTTTIPASFVVDIDKLILNSIWKGPGFTIAKIILKIKSGRNHSPQCSGLLHIHSNQDSGAPMRG